MLWGSQDADTFVDIEDTIELKIESLKRHVSQISSTESDTDVDEFVKASASRMGQRAEVPYAEAFRRISFRR